MSRTISSALLFTMFVACPGLAQEGGSRSPLLWASHIYLAEAQYAVCDEAADRRRPTVPCDLTLLILETLKGVSRSQAMVTVHSDLPRPTEGPALDIGDPWGALEVEPGDRFLLFTAADGKYDLQNRLIGEKLRLAMGANSTRQARDVADVRLGVGTLQSGDPRSAALRELTLGRDWGELFAQFARELLEPENRAAVAP